MTFLDQAFIKAFSQQGASPVVMPQEPAAPAREPWPSPVAPKLEAAAAQQEVAAPKKEVAAKREVAPSPISDVFRDVLATLEKPPALPTRPAKTETPEDSLWRSQRGCEEMGTGTSRDAAFTGFAPTGSEPVPVFSQPQRESATGAWAADCWQPPLDAMGSVGIAESVCIAEPVNLPEFAGMAESVDLANPIDAATSVGLADPVGEAEYPVEAPLVRQLNCRVSRLPQRLNVPLPVPSARQLNCRTDAMPSTVNHPPATVRQLPSHLLSAFSSREEPPARPEFKPAWQVDRFTWPRVCRRLMAKANDEFDRLADALMAANARGQKVLAMAGCCRGEGATTLLLCAARRLAERGVKLVLVDADLARPRIAKRLGVQPQVGWNETSDEEGTPLDHAVVEAAANDLALSTVRDPASPTGHTTGDWSRLAPCLETLKHHYEMVLVDLGPLENIESIGDALNRTVDGKIDAVLLVHNRRITSAERLSQVEQELTASGVALAGMIENFVAV